MGQISTESALKQRHLSLVLTILAVALWAVSITQAELNIGYYGLIHSFPPTFFVALALLTIASALLWVSRENHGGLLSLQLCLLITALWLTPVLIGSNPVFASIMYRDYSFIDYIIQYGQFNPALLWYHSWPGIWVVEAAYTEIVGTEIHDKVVSVGPFLMQFLVLLPLYVFLKNTINNVNRRWAAAWIFYLGNWTGQIYVAPQAMGLFLLLTLLALLTRTALQERRAAVSDRIVTVLVVACLAITHLLTSIAGILSIALLWATRQHRQITISLMITAAVFVAAWTLYGAATQLQWQLPRFVERAFRLDLVFAVHFVEHAGASASHEAVREVRTVFSGLFALIGIVGILLSPRLKDKADRTLLAVAALSVMTALSGLYGWELLIRSYLLALAPIAYFGVKLLNFRVTSVVLVLLLLTALPLNIVAHYGNAAADYIPRGEIAYWHFVQDKATEGYLTGGLSPWYMGYAGYTRVDFEQLEWNDDRLGGRAVDDNRPHYVDIGEYDEAAYEFRLNDTEFIPETHARLENSVHYDLVYANRDLRLYLHEK